MTDSHPLIFDRVPLAQWQENGQDKPIFVLAESVINPQVRTLADKALNESPSESLENCLYWGKWVGFMHPFHPTC